MLTGRHFFKSQPATFLSLACGIPCAVVTVGEAFVFFVLGETPEHVAPATVLALLSLGLLPFAVAALVIAVFAERWRGWCLGVSLVYFVGWGVLFLSE